ncbi:MAG: helix-turn-helix domain-containing protein [Balneolaceae bacterium]|nr:helix-turn-helix domain-containing protein [Balneolaceae bacterium]
MSTEERRKREKERRRRQILEAAKELISEKGIDSLTMSEIANRAELSKGTLYLYFENKTDLCLAITGMELEDLFQDFNAIIQKDKPGLYLIEEMGDTFLDYVSSRPHYLNTMMMNEARRHSASPDEFPEQEELEDVARRLLMTITRAIQIGMQDGSITSDMNPKILAVQFWGGMRGIMHLLVCDRHGPVESVLEESGLTKHDIFRQFNRVLLQGIKSQNHNAEDHHDE